MDTVALNPTLSTLSSSGACVAECTGQDAAEDAGTADFATLLAAGMELMQAAAAPEQNAAEALPAATDPAAPAAAAPDALAALPQSALPIAVPATQPQSPAAGSPSAAAPAPAARNALQEARQAAPVAADAAILAAQTAAASSDAFDASDAPAAAGHGEPSHGFAAELASIRELAGREAQAPDAPRHASIAEAAAAHPLAHAHAPDRSAASPSTALLEIGAPVGGPGFADALSRQVVWMVDKDAQVAELRINPPELGPVEVRLTLSGEEASAQFVSAHAEVRNAIESALSRLRESMAQAGIQLGEATVSAESFRDQTAAQQGERDTWNGYRGGSDAGASMHAPERARTSVARGLIDVFA